MEGCARADNVRWYKEGFRRKEKHHILRFPVPNEKVPWKVSACPGLTHQAAGAQCPGGSGLGPRVAEPTAASKGHEGQMKREA